MKQLLLILFGISALGAFAQPDTTEIKKLKYTNVKFYLGQKKVLKDVLLYDAWAMGKLDIYPVVADSLAKFLLLRKNVVIELGGHSDCTNTKDPGTNAAKAVKDYLLTKGVPADRLQTRGYGNALPLVPCPDGGTINSNTFANRRVEAKIVDFVKPNFTYQDSVLHSGQVMVFNGLAEDHPIDFDTLSNLANFLSKFPKHKVEIGAHSDSRGTKQEKLDRSTYAASIVKKDLVNFGVDSSRLTTVGYGDAYILNECRGTTKCLEEQHQVNRRVEIKILSVE